MADEQLVSYPLKDILGRMEDKLDALKGKLDAALVALATKAEHGDLLQLADRVSRLEQNEENRSADKKWHTELQRWLIPTLLSAAATVATVLALLHG